ncbi:MAG TPA: hypothetical protein VIA09_01055 [Nitrososphaeraceae archaeon]|jgi:hypothetical protein
MRKKVTVGSIGTKIYFLIAVISLVVASTVTVIPVSAFHLYQEPCDISPGCGFSSKKQCFEVGKNEFAFSGDRDAFNQWKKECRHQ